MSLERQTFLVDFRHPEYDQAPTPWPYDDANLVSSLTEDGTHMPALDLDVPARLIPSSTPGHSHLYIDVPIPWEKYERILDALADAGILEPGYVAASKAEGATFLRKPGLMKEAA